MCPVFPMDMVEFSGLDHPEYATGINIKYFRTLISS